MAPQDFHFFQLSWVPNIYLMWNPLLLLPSHFNYGYIISILASVSTTKLPEMNGGQSTTKSPRTHWQFKIHLKFWKSENRTLWRTLTAFFLKCACYNLFVKSKNEFSNSPIHEFKVLHKSQSLLKPLFNGVLVLSYYFKKHFQPCFLF